MATEPTSTPESTSTSTSTSASKVTSMSGESTTVTFQPTMIIFDLLTALLDSWSVWDAAITAISSDSTPAFVTTTDSIGNKAIDGQTWRKRYLELTYSCGSYAPYEFLVERSALDVGLPSASSKALLERWDQIQPWEEVPDVLLELRERGYRLGVVTNCSNELGWRAVENCCKEVNALLGQRRQREAERGGDFKFDAVVTAEESGFYKPHPKPYLDVLKQLGIAGGGVDEEKKARGGVVKEVLFVAGSAADIPGAMGVGMTVCWHNRIGLERKNDVLPWKEGGTLREALGEIITT